jgi:hypothetical protein
MNAFSGRTFFVGCRNLEISIHILKEKKPIKNVYEQKKYLGKKELCQ